MFSLNERLNALNSNIAVRYNAETDMVQIFYNNIWNDWKAGNMQNLVIVNEDKIIPFSPFIKDSNCAASWNTDNSQLTVTITSGVVNNNVFATLVSTNALYLNGFRKIKISYTANAGSGNVEMCLHTTKPTTASASGVTARELYYFNTDGASKTGTVELDLSTLDLSIPYYVALKTRSWNSQKISVTILGCIAIK